jgi:hypothetical protein
MNDYNTVRPPLILKEYGRNVQKLVAHIKKIEDVEKRTESAYVLVELMKLINPGIKDAQETNQKLWDDLVIMSEFDIELNGPFPTPDRAILFKKPQRLGYKPSEVRFKHYGRNIELLIKKATSIEDPEEKEAAIIYIGRLMKGFQNAWNRENVDDSTIVKDIEILSKNQLTIDLEKVRAQNLFESLVKERKNKPQQQQQVMNKNRRNNGGGGRRRRN